MNKIKYIKYILLGISLVIFVYFLFTTGNPVSIQTGVGVLLTWAYIILGLGILSALLFPLANLISNPKGAMRSLIGLALIIVVVGVAYALSSDTPVLNSAGRSYFTDSFTLKLTDTELYTAYFALAAAVAAILFGEIRNAIKGR